MKITVVGAGAVGASCAEYIAIKNFASEVVILDIKEGFAEGKAMDLMQTASLNNFDTKIVGTTNDYSKTADSDICIRSMALRSANPSFISKITTSDAKFLIAIYSAQLAPTAPAPTTVIFIIFY
jgi:2-polyprenyl-6-methoxyphenol hydroxylase-like FAD-dependent oxidoreductase